MSQQPQQTDAPPSPSEQPPQPQTNKPEGFPGAPAHASPVATSPPVCRAYSPSKLARLALLPLTIPDPSNSPSSNSSPSSPVSVVESDDSMEYDTSKKSTAYAYFGELEANTGNRPQSGPLTMALLRAAEVINTSAGELSLHPSNPPPVRDMAILRSLASQLSGLTPQTRSTHDLRLTRQEILMAAEAAQRNPDVLERVKARALVEALEKARYDLAMDAVRMAQVQAEVLESARERMKDEQSDALAEWRSVDWESLPEADRASIRKNAEHDILQIAIAKVKQEEQEISVEAKRANTAEIETWKLTELEATKAELLAEAKSKVTVKIFANHEKFREEAMAELKDKIDFEAKAWGVNHELREAGGICGRAQTGHQPRKRNGLSPSP
ncbi:hypothetical protein EI94DRAFT_1921859 [Lactarius quietus]|nr:hypothetical protein EI94DRAFT_1921859 [Lactarius quietus]